MEDLGRFAEAIRSCSEQIARSRTPEDLTHAHNTMSWILRLRPEADEILQLAGLAHDIHRSMPDRLQRDDFDTYDAFLLAHAQRSAAVAGAIVESAGYEQGDVRRLRYLIENGEFHSDDDDDVQLLRDANSISIFDNNSHFYLDLKGPAWTTQKLQNNYERASPTALEHIDRIIESRPDLRTLHIH